MQKNNIKRYNTIVLFIFVNSKNILFWFHPKLLLIKVQRIQLKTKEY